MLNRLLSTFQTFVSASTNQDDFSSLAVECLEDRQMLSGSYLAADVALDDNVLTVQSDSASVGTIVEISEVGAQLVVREYEDVGGIHNQLRETSFNTSDVVSIEFLGNEFNDELTIATSLNSYILGAGGDDILNGGSGADLIAGGNGDDTINGGAGHDSIYGQSGQDTLVGAAGHDRIFGGNEDDTIHGDQGNDLINGGNGVDEIFGGGHQDNINGGSGDDVIRGEDGNDFILGGSGDDDIWGGNGRDILRGQTGNDTIFGEGSVDWIRGDADNDILDGGLGSDLIEGGDDNDTIYGRGGRDTIHGQSGNDIVYGGSGDDIITGEQGDDLLHGGSGADEIHGGTGIDNVNGAQGDDILFGNAGDDYVLGSSGDDQLFGGTGNDLLASGDDNDIVHGGQGQDRILGGNGNDELYGDGDADDLFGQQGDDFLDGGQNDLAHDILVGGSGSDYFYRVGERARNSVFIAQTLPGLPLAIGSDRVSDFSESDGDSASTFDELGERCIGPVCEPVTNAPDLSVSNLQVLSSTAVGQAQNLTYSYDLSVLGDVLPDTYFVVQAVFRGTVDGEAVEFRKQNRVAFNTSGNPVAAGSQTLTTSAPTLIAGGNYEFSIEVDTEDDRILELDENNNSTLSVAVTIVSNNFGTTESTQSNSSSNPVPADGVSVYSSTLTVSTSNTSTVPAAGIEVGFRARLSGTFYNTIAEQQAAGIFITPLASTTDANGQLQFTVAMNSDFDSGSTSPSTKSLTLFMDNLTNDLFIAGANTTVYFESVV